MRLIEMEVAKILEDEASLFHNYLDYLREEGDRLKDDNLVLDLLGVIDVDSENILHLLPWARTNRDSKKSFVIVTTAVDIDEIPEELSIVPTLGEAEDLIQMEEIERDLGF